jgi:predicted adenine nucleotide alpha hydrolase (AANH) superfamily ATPase
VFYYNPNITEETEYRKRVEEQKRFIQDFPTKHKVTFLEGNYDTGEYYAVAKEYALEPEGGKRCEKCFNLRLRETARVAKKHQFDYFTTTLTISPLKNAQLINEIGEQLAKEYEICYLYSDFKKKEGYKRSIVLSGEYDLYRQDYCGCVYSKR